MTENRQSDGNMTGEDLIRAGVVSVASGPLKADVGTSAVLLDFASPAQAQAFTTLIAKAAFDWPDAGPAEQLEPSTGLRISYKDKEFRPVTNDQAQALKAMIERPFPFSITSASPRKAESE